MNTDQLNLLINKLEKLQREREKEEPGPVRTDKSKSKRGAPAASHKYPNDITKYEVIQNLGAGTFGRVKQVVGPNKEVLALKQLSKSHIINLKQVDHIKMEKKILAELNHPFIYSLKTAFQDDTFIYMIFEYCSGGELFNRLRKDGRFSNDVTMFYICEILLAFCHMHSKNIIYRDLKPENLLIDREGHVKLADFGFAKKLFNDRTFTLCGTPEYLAPEIITGSKEGYGRSSDWWALGILVYELLAGHPPFYDMKPLGIYQKILKGIIEFPGFMSLRAKDLIRKLLNPEVKYRIGVHDVKGLLLRLDNR